MLKLQLILLAILQGVSELFPVSSLGHSVLIPGVLHWSINRQAPWFLPFIVVLHICTAAALFLYFWRDWLGLFKNFVADKGRPVSPESKLLWLLIVGTIPAGILGLAFEHLVRSLFGGITIAAVFLMLNGILLIAGDRLKHREGKPLATLSWKSAFAIGCAQALALIPGISRSGVTLIGGLMSGLDYAAAARFSFLLATPVIGAAGLLEIPKLMKEGVLDDGISMSLIIVCGLLSGIFAWLSTAFLMRYFKNHEAAALKPFGIYCLIAGAAALLLQSI